MNGELLKFEIGRKYMSPGRTLTEADLNLFNNACWSVADLHTNEEYAKQTIFGTRIFPGATMLAISLGLDCIGDFRLALRGEGRRLMALLEFEYIKFFVAVKPGDTVHLETEVLEARDTKKPSRQVMRIKDRLVNQNGDLVQEDVRRSLVGKIEG
ncbi:MAG: MaoC/PaaZ C-terminal domain-containing protein [Desulfobacteraceae bacterium]